MCVWSNRLGNKQAEWVFFYPRHLYVNVFDAPP